MSRLTIWVIPKPLTVTLFPPAMKRVLVGVRPTSRTALAFKEPKSSKSKPELKVTVCPVVRVVHWYVAIVFSGNWVI